ncbi:MAG: deoxyribonuclease V [Chloroflexi bacterium]|nr:deoxyribonuclease V [Chloroflexota bacterium]
MKAVRLHDWQVTPRQAMTIQSELASKVSKVSHVSSPGLIAGLDISVNRIAGTATAAVAVLGYPELETVEVQVEHGRPEFPYVPGLLSFREAPLTIAACEKLVHTPDLLLVDGHGYAHPRRMGIACHLGLLLDTPTIGCAKSRLIGEHEEPAEEAGSWTPLIDSAETIGAALRTKSGARPVYVSIGHKVDLATAIDWVMRCCRGYRLPEPARLAHQASKGNLSFTVEPVH